MSKLYGIAIMAILLITVQYAIAQPGPPLSGPQRSGPGQSTINHAGLIPGGLRGKILDAGTKEPVPGATIHCSHQGCGDISVSGYNGDFELKCAHGESVSVSSIGYTTQNISLSPDKNIVSLVSSQSMLQQVVVSANRGEGVKRSLAPVAIATLSSKTIQDSKPTTLDQVLNKVSGVNMVNLGNEQHQMSIRQPMTTKSLFAG